MHPKGTSFGAPVVKFIERLDLEQIISSMDRHKLTIPEKEVSWMSFSKNLEHNMIFFLIAVPYCWAFERIFFLSCIEARCFMLGVS